MCDEPNLLKLYKNPETKDRFLLGVYLRRNQLLETKRITLFQCKNETMDHTCMIHIFALHE